MVCPRDSEREVNQTKVISVCVSVCVAHVRHYSVIQHDSGCRLEGRGSSGYSHLAENGVSVNVCVCGQVINSALKSH